jgi:predicted nicotinamide N-methyase
MSMLKDMYMPPIHGGFTAGDVELDEPEPEAKADEAAMSSKRKSRTLSGGTVDLVPDELGLDMEGLKFEDVIEEDDGEYAEDDGEDEDYNDPFEREWAEKWLSGVVRRAQTWLEAETEPAERVAEYEAVLREATAVLALMAGTSAAGSLTRHLLFPLAPELVPALRALKPFSQPNPSMSPQTATFLASLATSPVSPLVGTRALPRKRGDSMSSIGSSPSNTSHIRRKDRLAALPVLLHDAPISDHLSVGVQTWGSAILLGREMSLRPRDFGLFQDILPHGEGTRVLELGAGTGLLSILCRKLLDLQSATAALAAPTAPAPRPGIVVATDFHPDVIANLRVCVDLNATPRLPNTPAGPGIDIAKLDWTTFPAFMEKRARWLPAGMDVPDEELAPWVDTPFDLVLASDCVYDPTHAALLRQVAGWVLRPPSDGVPGGTMHLLSPIRPTFTPELESIDVAFPTIASYAPLAERQAAAAAASGDHTAVPAELRGEGLGAATGHRIGVRGTGKRSVKHRRGEGRSDEGAGYWWWEVTWG